MYLSIAVGESTKIGRQKYEVRSAKVRGLVAKSTKWSPKERTSRQKYEVVGKSTK